MKSKILLKLVSSMVAVAMIASLGIFPAFAKVIPGTGLVAYDPMKTSGAIAGPDGSGGTTSGVGWSAYWTRGNIGGSGAVSYNKNSNVVLYAPYNTDTTKSIPYLNFSGGTCDAYRTFPRTDATAQPVWISFIWRTDAANNNQANSFSIRQSNGAGGFTPLISAKMRTNASGVGSVIMEKGAHSDSTVAANETDTGLGVPKGTNYIVLKLHNKTVTAYINPVVADIDFTNETKAVETLEAQYGGTTGKPAPTVVTLDNDLIADNIYFKATATLRVTEVRVGFEAMNVARFTAKTVGTLQTEVPDFTFESAYDIIDEENGKITAYGAGTVEDFLNLFTVQDATLEVLDSDGQETVGNTEQVEEGMILSVVPDDDSVDPSLYTLGEKLRIDSAGIYVNGYAATGAEEGDATAKATVYSAMPCPVTLSLTHYDTTASNTVTNETGTTELETPVAGTVQNLAGEKLTMTLQNSAGTDLVEPAEVTYTGVPLELKSEILDVKGGANSIVTLTFDDGISGDLSTANNLLSARKLKGTAMIWQDRLAENVNFYKGIFNNGYIDLGSHSKTHTTLLDSHEQ